MPSGAEEEKFKSTVKNLFADDEDNIKRTNNYLLLIAIDHYKDAGLNLNNPVRDANALLEVLLKRFNFSSKEYKQFGSEGEKDEYEKDTFVTLKKKELDAGKDRYKGEAENYKVYKSERIICLYNEDANVDNIDIAVNTLIAGMEPDSQLLIYFSGHGFRNEKRQGHPFTLTSFDYDIGKTTTYLYLDNLTNQGDTVKCRNLLLIIDACHAGSALLGNKHEGDEPYSREIMVSCSEAELASDGTKYTGSPFSQVLVDILQNHTKSNQLELLDLASQTKNKVALKSQGRQQNVSFGKAPTFENGSETYRFQLADCKTPDVKLFAESIINHLNFTDERRYFAEEIDITLDSKNKDYYILSTVTTNIKVERLRGNIISKSFAGTLRVQEETSFLLKRLPGWISWDMIGVNSVEDIFDSIARKFNLKGTGMDENVNTVNFTYQEKIEYFSSSIGRILEASDDTHNPLCVVFIISNFSPGKHENLVSQFIIQLIRGIEKYKKHLENKARKWDKLLLYIISKTEENVNDLNSFSDKSSKGLLDLFKVENLHEPFFKTFGKIGFINKPFILTWLKKTGDAFDAEGYKNFKKRQIATGYFPNEDDLTMDVVLYKLADEIYDSEAYKEQLFKLLFF